jgi:hypothetical protein
MEQELSIKEWKNDYDIIQKDFKNVMEDIAILLRKFVSDIRVINFSDVPFWKKNIVDYHNHHIFIPLDQIGNGYQDFVDKILVKIGEIKNVSVIVIDGLNFSVKNDDGISGIWINYGWLNLDEEKSSHAE